MRLVVDGRCNALLFTSVGVARRWVVGGTGAGYASELEEVWEKGKGRKDEVGEEGVEEVDKCLDL